MRNWERGGVGTEAGKRSLLDKVLGPRLEDRMLMPGRQPCTCRRDRGVARAGRTNNASQAVLMSRDSVTVGQGSGGSYTETDRSQE